MTRIIMSGCSGHMGRVISELVMQDENAEVVAGIDLVVPEDSKYPVYPSFSEVKEDADVLIDFSTPKILSALLAEGKKRNMPLVLCTTGYTKEQVAEIEAASKELPIVRSANMSLGVNVLIRLVQEAAKTLAAEGFDIEIVEKHHRLKKDAPSGTALAIADAINAALPQAKDYVFDRSTRSEQRPRDEIGISAVRGGTIVGDHDVLFCGTDEVITISHTAYSKAIFGKGAVAAAKYLAGQKPGLYTMKDVIG
ncbi:MAG: 4-hydroxy-tetrahydrodipicolinate reductase [Lachnospiraceae bacterium]|nr:4-hydroxy-tetrahydrodipicolinate reductase [Lachnospiraceae bacterium]